MTGCWVVCGRFYSRVCGKEGARGGTREMGNKVSSDKELTEVGRMVESDWGERRRLRREGSDKRVHFFEDVPQRMKTRVVGSD